MKRILFFTMLSQVTLFLLFGISGSLSTTMSEEWLESSVDFQNDLTIDTRIVGGGPVSIRQFNFLAYLEIENNLDVSICGGSIITSTVILTAAHCLHISPPLKNVNVRVGSSDSWQGGVLRRSSKFHLHPKYNSYNIDYDVAVIILPQALRLDDDTVGAVKLADYDSDLISGQRCTVAGWGYTAENGQFSRYLLAVHLVAVSRYDCGRHYDNIEDHNLCAGCSRGRDACEGDNGGPLVTTRGKVKTQVGIVSYGDGCARKGVPKVYSRIGERTIRRWIRQIAGV